MNHTPGPWTVGFDPVVSQQILGPDMQEFVCILPPSRDYKANANIIAAAPELLEACKELKKQIRTLRAERKEDWKQERVNTVWAAIVQADKAIAKAEGRA